MPIIVNGTSITRVVVDGKTIDRVNVDGATVYQSSISIFNNGNTAASGAWVSGGTGNNYTGVPQIGSQLTFAAARANSYWASLAWTSNKIQLDGGKTIRVNVNKAASYQTDDTNLGIGVQHLAKLELVLCAGNKPNINGVGDARAELAKTCRILTIIDGYKGFYGDVVTGSMSTGSYTVTVPVSGNYYVGLLWDGYDCLVVSTPGVNNITAI